MSHRTDICQRCGVKVSRPHGTTWSFAHTCSMPPNVKVYSDEEKKEFERRRLEEERNREKGKKTFKKATYPTGKAWTLAPGAQLG